ncbi:MAG: DUF5717 family protein [Lachnospiraceae bacterium]|nr:DUF5717 family protein [Lachnospiraceae bacterium]MDY5742158.1 DUF5717 family protein [Lachnospiraceae bacterium]
MRTVIQKILEENIRYTPVTLVIDGMTLSQIDAYQWLGSFSVSESRGERLYLRISSDCYRIVPLKKSSYGKHEKIEFMVDTEGLPTDTEQIGHVMLHSAAGEQAVEVRLPQQTSLTASTEGTEAALPESLETFVGLARKSFREAFRLFVSSRFTKLLQKDRPQLLALYQGYMIPPIEYQNMEDFLVEAGLKEGIKTEVVFPEQHEFTVSGQEAQTIVIRKQTWGYCQYRLSTDASWLSLEKNTITGDDFIGSQCIISFYIDSRKMRSGKNPARLAVTGINLKKEYHLTACCRPLHEAVVAKLEAQAREVQWLRSDLEYRAAILRGDRQAATSAIRESLMQVEKLRFNSPKNRLYNLMEIQALVHEGELTEAKRLLKELLVLVQEDGGTVSAVFRMWYLYLSACTENSLNYRQEVLRSLDQLVQENGKSGFGLTLFLTLRKEVENSSIANLQQIQEQYRSGRANAYLYLMAFELLQQYPSLISSLDDFTVQVLWAACRHRVMTETMVQHVTAILPHAGFSRLLYRLICALEKHFGSDVFLQAICTWLIKNGKIGPAYFDWYAKAVERDIRLTRLYEYYVDSIDSGKAAVLPKMVRLYFSYNTSLGYKKKAMIYRNIVTAKEQEPDGRLEQAFDIEEFVKDQLLSQRINEDLGFLYDRFLNNINMNKRMAQNMAEMLFVQALPLPDPAIKSIEVIYPQLKRSFHYGVDRGIAYPAICYSQAVIMGLDEKGRKWYIPVPKEPKYLLQNRNFIHLCRGKGANQLLLSIYLAYEGGQLTVNEDTIPVLVELLQSKEIHKQEQQRIEKALLEYWHTNARQAQIRHVMLSVGPSKAQLEQLGYDHLAKADPVKMIEILLLDREYEEAFRLLHFHDYRQIDTKLLLWLFNDRLQHHGEDSLLTELALYLLGKKMYHGPLLQYLSHMDGLLLDQMLIIRQKMIDFLLGHYEIEEKLLVELLLQCRSIHEYGELIRSYCGEEGKPQLIAACATRLAYEMVFYNQGLTDDWLSLYQRLYERYGCINRLFGLGYLKLLAVTGHYEEGSDPRHLSNAGELLDIFEKENIYLNTFACLRRALKKPALFADAVCLEFFGEQNSQVALLVEQDHTVQIYPMRQVYPGIFCKDLTLFYDDVVSYQYRITENGEEKLTEKQTLSRTGQGQSFDESRYGLINRMLELESQFHNDELVYTMGRFIKNERFIAENFSIE